MLHLFLQGLYGLDAGKNTFQFFKRALIFFGLSRLLFKGGYFRLQPLDNAAILPDFIQYLSNVQRPYTVIFVRQVDPGLHKALFHACCRPAGQYLNHQLAIFQGPDRLQGCLIALMVFDIDDIRHLKIINNSQSCPRVNLINDRFNPLLRFLFQFFFRGHVFVNRPFDILQFIKQSA